jgi:phage terminase large subunit
LSATKHWVYNSVVTRYDVGFLKTTFLDNPHISDNERNEILSYEPNEHNLKQGTASIYDWNVFGLGLRSAREGLVFQEGVNWDVKKFPETYKWHCYGLDFGFTNDPSTLIEIAFYEGDIYVREIFYNTGLLTNDLAELLKDIKGVIIADSASPLTIADLNNDSRVKANIYPAKKGPDSINNGVALMKKHKTYIDPDSKNIQEERRNYTWSKDRQGHSLNKPIDKWNHAIDAERYVTSYKLKNNSFKISLV